VGRTALAAKTRAALHGDVDARERRRLHDERSAGPRCTRPSVAARVAANDRFTPP
jgi:hypothetical protein